MAMTVADLIAQLEDFDGECEVRFASQPSWPFEYSISDTLVEGGDDCEHCYGEGCETCGGRGIQANVVYIAEGRQLGYLPGEVKNELGW